MARHTKLALLCSVVNFLPIVGPIVENKEISAAFSVYNERERSGQAES